MTYLSFSFVVRGKVQGVNFRNFARESARKSDVVGWVANDTKGNVIGEVQGQESVIERFKKALRTGPPHATVIGVDVSNERDLDRLEYETFEIRR